MKCGGVKQATAATAETQAVLTKVKEPLEAKLGRKLDTFEAISVATQVSLPS